MAQLPPDAPPTLREAVGHARVEFAFQGRRTPLHPFVFRIFLWAVSFGGMWALVLIAIVLPPLLGHATTWQLNGQPVVITRANLGMLSPFPQILLGIVVVTGALAAATFRLAIPPRPWFAATADALLVSRGASVERVPWRDLARATEVPWTDRGILLMRRRDAHPTLVQVLFRRAKPVVMKGVPDVHGVVATCQRHIEATTLVEERPRAWQK